MFRLSLSATLVAAGLSGSANAGGPITIMRDLPDFDRWNYPFNITPGSRPAAPTFGAFVEPVEFDQRDGQFLVSWETIRDVMPDLARGQYRITSAVVTSTVAPNTATIYDPTPDPYTSYISGMDPDPGRAVILTGTDFRNDFDAASWGETGPHGGAGVGERFAYAASYDDAGVLIDISNNVADAFDPLPFAVGAGSTSGGTPLQPGDLVPTSAAYRFELDVDNEDIQCYLRTGLRDGILSFSITSLHDAVQPAFGSFAFGGTPYPQWRTKEDLEVAFGLADGTSLELTVEITPDDEFNPADVNDSGTVNIDDLFDIINAFGDACNCCPEDANDTGVVNIDDLFLVINNFS